DLSDVMFVATSNSVNIPGPLHNRMEMIRIPGYTEDENISIATRNLLPNQVKTNGLLPKEITITTKAIQYIVRYYTRQSGVRNLEREIAKICRKVVRQIALAGPEQPAGTGKAAKAAKGKSRRKPKPVKIDSANLDAYLGVRR